MDKFITITINGIQTPVERGTRLSDILEMEKPCGANGICKKCKVNINGKDELACRYTVEREIDVKTYKNEDVVSQSGVVVSGTFTKNVCFALDIGTTTLSLALISLSDKKPIGVISATNPQRTFGADVISRIYYCRKNSVTKLHDVLVDTINRMILEFDTDFVEKLYVSANVTMLHTLFGIDCSALGVYPYTPQFLNSRTQSAHTLGIRGVKTIISLPSSSTFIGADIVAGLGFLNSPHNKYNLLVDLGTNAEIVLYSKNGGVATSAAAGPCFEGVNISCGMSATPGAIYSFEQSYGHTSYKTIANQKATGICGTGLIDIICELVKNDVIDDTGYMSSDYTVCDGVYLSPEDVRQFQLAKSAVCSAILTLIKTEKIGFDDIAAMYISGGFSAQINVANAVNCGLLPKELRSKAKTVNNSCLQGTIKFACEGKSFKNYADKIKYVDLSASDHFSELFIKNMSFNQ